MKAIKLIWLSDRLHLRKFGRPILKDTYYAMKLGPVPSYTRDIIEQTNLEDIEREYSRKFLKTNDLMLESKCDPVLSVFSQTDRETLELIYDSYKGLDEFELSTLSHDFPEWKRYQNSFNAYTKRFPIFVEDFFIGVKDFTHLFEKDDENVDAAQKVYEETCKLASVFS